MKEFFKTELWTLKLADYSFITRNLLKSLRIGILTFRCFMKNKCMLQASALTYYTLLSIVPVAALAFAIAKGFGMYAKLETWLRTSLADKPDVAEKIIEYSNTMLDSAKGGVIAGFGAVALIIVTIRLMIQIENSLNDIWGVKTGRPILRKISDYLSIVLLCPLIIIISTGITVYASMRLDTIARDFPGLSSGMGFLLELSSRLLPLIATWLLFTFIYVFIPNTKVKIVPALAGGFVSALFYHVVQTLYLAAQFNVAKYNAIYGSFAALPLFLIWLQMSWTFILLGAEITFAAQNVTSYEGIVGEGDVGNARKMVYALKIVDLCVKSFRDMTPSPTDLELSAALEIPVRITRHILFDLTEAKVLSKVMTKDRSDAYQIAVPPEKLTPVFVMRSLLNPQTDPELDQTDPVLSRINELWEAAEQAPANNIGKI